MRALILLTFAATALPLLITASGATAQTATDTFEVRARVTKTCTVVANDIDFGVYNSSTASRSSNTMSVTCTPGTSFQIQVGSGGSGNRGDRYMSGPGTLRYGLFKDGGYTQPTETSGNDFTGTSDPQGTPVTFQLYGQILASQTVPAGNYLDTVTVTVTY
ncbi:MAG: spore coat U domain-containing protein [Caulobacter sp.]|nr:spore coat U domain-containing protein [Caulobacter sp.]